MAAVPDGRELKAFMYITVYMFGVVCQPAVGACHLIRRIHRQGLRAYTFQLDMEPCDVMVGFFGLHTCNCAKCAFPPKGL